MNSFVNPYNEKKAEMLKEFGGDIPKEKEIEYALLEEQSREFVKEKLEEAYSMVERVEEEVIQIKKLPSLNKQYREFKKLHKIAKELAKKIGDTKISVLHELRPQNNKDEEVEL